MLDLEIKELEKWKAHELYYSYCSWRKAIGGSILHCFTTSADDVTDLKNTLCGKVYPHQDLAYYYIKYPHCQSCARKYRLLEEKVQQLHMSYSL